jgi:hypothetical protein
MLKMSSLPEVAVVEVEVAGKGRGVLGGGALKKQETPENYLHVWGIGLYGGCGWSTSGEVNNPGLVPDLRHWFKGGVTSDGAFYVSADLYRCHYLAGRWIVWRSSCMMQRTMLCRQHVASTILLSLDAMWMEIIAGLS